MDDEQALELLKTIKPELDRLKQYANSKGKNNKTRKFINRVIQNENPELGKIELPKVSNVNKERNDVLKFQLPNSKIRIVNIEGIKQRWAKKERK